MNIEKDALNDVHVTAEQVLISPRELKARLPADAPIKQLVERSRREVEAILDGRDHRLLVVTGPCSIHDVDAALDYARRLKALQAEVADTLLIVMRVYFEKPRTTVGWKGLINDPYMDDSFRISEGLAVARSLLLEIARIGLPAGTEALDPISPQYMSDLFAWSAIGARTTESQTHREMASGLSMPVGFKNGTDGGLGVAINAMQSARSPHAFLGINPDGQVAVIQTEGNHYGHMILRGGNQPNYDSVNVSQCEKTLAKSGLACNLVVDCSHGNSSKQPELQPLVADNIVNQIVDGNNSIIGIMLESNLFAGNQSIPADLADLQYGISVTDACIDWDTTESLLRTMHAKLHEVLPRRRRQAP